MVQNQEKSSSKTEITMNIYLDIDGVILDKEGNPAKHLFKFLQRLTSLHTVFWLSTHCKGDKESVTRFLERRVTPEIMPLVQLIEPTNWQTLKTEAIDFTQDFRWFDDCPMEAEKRILMKNDCLSKLILVNLQSNPDFLYQQNI